MFIQNLIGIGQFTAPRQKKTKTKFISTKKKNVMINSFLPGQTLMTQKKLQQKNMNKKTNAMYS